MKGHTTRAEKIKLLSDLAAGRLTVAELMPRRTLHIVGIDEPHQYFIDDKPVSEEEYKEELRKAIAAGNIKFDVQIV